MNLEIHVGMSFGKFKNIAGKHWEVHLMRGKIVLVVIAHRKH